MSDLEIDFEELAEKMILGYQGRTFYQKFLEIFDNYKFETAEELAEMFEQWLADRKAGLHA